jgi:hypothetical protein
VITFLSKNELDYYSRLKTELLNNYGANHQNVRKDALKKNAMSVASKILLQINAKLG